MKGLQAALENAPSALAARSVLEGFGIATRYDSSFSSCVHQRHGVVNRDRTMPFGSWAKRRGAIDQVDLYMVSCMVLKPHSDCMHATSSIRLCTKV